MGGRRTRPIVVAGPLKEQQQALAGALSEVGWVAQVLVNRTTGHVVDGHLRVELAISRHELTVPVAYVELTQEEELLVLASLDPLAAMAVAEKEALAALLAGLSPGDDALATLLAELAEQNGIRRPVLGDPDEVPPVPDEADVYGTEPLGGIGCAGAGGRPLRVRSVRRGSARRKRALASSSSERE